MVAQHAQVNTLASARVFSSGGRTSRAVSRATPVLRCAAAGTGTPGATEATRVWHCPPPAEERTATQAASTLSKLPPHTLGAGGLDPATQSAQNQQAYLGSLAERFLPVDLGYPGVRVLNVDPPVFAIANFIRSSAECDALADLALGAAAAGDVKNVKSTSLGEMLPAPLGDGMPALAQRLGELVEEAQRFVRCDGAWLEGSMMNAWGMSGGFAIPPPPGAFAFEMPTLNVTPEGEMSDALPDGFEREAANDRQYQRRAFLRVFLTDPPPPQAHPPPEAAAAASDAPEAEAPPDIDRDAFSAKFVICDIGVAPAKGTAIVTFPSFADGTLDERTSTVMKAAAGSPVVWMDLPVSVGLEEGGIAAPLTMADVGTVEKIGEEANVGSAARDKNRQAWRASVNVGGGEEDAGATEEAKKKLEELKDAGL